jgi:hypothetical protein
MLRLGTAQLPSADDVSAADLARIPPGFHDGASADPAAEVVHERVNTLWEAGESTFGYTGTWSAAPAALKAQIPLSPDGHPDAVWASENQAMGLAAMWLGFTYDPARQLVGHADSGTYFYGLIASVAAPAHEDWAHVLEWVHDHFGLDTRFGFGDPGRWRVNGDLARIYPSSPSGCLVVAPDARDASASRTRFVSQVLRMQLYAASAWLAASKRYEDRARWNACFAEWTDVIPQVEDGPGQAELEAVVARVRAAFASSIDAPGGYTAAEARAKPFLNPMRHDPLPLPR